MKQTINGYFEQKIYSELRGWLNAKGAPSEVKIDDISIDGVARRKNNAVFDGMLIDGVDWSARLTGGMVARGWYGLRVDDFRVEQRPDQ